MIAMKKKCSKLILSSIALLLLSGCAHVISKEVRREVTKDLTVAQVLKDPDVYKGRGVLWGGVIIESQNLREGTQIVVLEKKLGWRGRPKESDQSRGRFIVLHPGYLETAIYRKDREITVAGEIIGRKVMPIDQMDYTYPVLTPRQIHLWEEEREGAYPYYGPDPWWWHYPYWRYPYRYPYRHWYW